MDAKVDKSSDKMRERLNTIERRLKSVNTHMQHLSEQAEKMLRGKLDAARHKLQAQ